MPNVTPNGKQIEIVGLNGYNLFKAQFTSGGEPPKELKGTFTSKKYAQDAIDKYLIRIETEKKPTSAKISPKAQSK